MKRSLTIVAMLAFGASVIGSPAGAQGAPVGHPSALRELDDVKPGTKLRVVTLTNPPERIQGRLVGVRSGSFELDVGGSRRRELSLSQLLRADESYRDHTRGALAGLIPGVVGVYVWDFVGPHARYADQHQRYRENVIALAASCAVGALVGGVVGWQRWRPLQTSAR